MKHTNRKLTVMTALAVALIVQSDYRVFPTTHAQMLLNLHKKTWMDGLQLEDFKEHTSNNEKTIKVHCLYLKYRHASAISQAR